MRTFKPLRIFGIIAFSSILSNQVAAQEISYKGWMDILFANVVQVNSMANAPSNIREIQSMKDEIHKKIREAQLKDFDYLLYNKIKVYEKRIVEIEEVQDWLGGEVSLREIKVLLDKDLFEYELRKQRITPLPSLGPEFLLELNNMLQPFQQYYDTGNWEQAKDELHLLVGQYGSVYDFMIKLILCNIKIGDEISVLETLEAFEKTLPDDGDFSISAAELSMSQGSFHMAERLLSKALKSQTLTQTDRIMLLIKKAICNYKLNDFDSALDDFTRAKGFPTVFPTAYSLIAEIHYQKGYYGLALHNYRSYYPSISDSPSSLEQLIKYLDANGQSDQVMFEVNKMVRSNTRSASYLFIKGKQLLVRKRKSAAFDAFSKCISMNEKPEFYFYRGLASWSLKKKEIACNDFKHAYDLGWEPAVEYLNKCNK